MNVAISDTIHQIHGSMSSITETKWMLLPYHLPFLLQVSLLHQKFYSDSYQRYRTFFRVLRLSMVLVNIWVAFEMKSKISFTPATHRGPLNLQFGCWVVHLVMKSIEWGIVSNTKDNPNYQLRSEFHSAQLVDQKLSSKKYQEHKEEIQVVRSASSSTKPSTINDQSFKHVLIWSLNQLTSLRGINYNWGWNRREPAIPTVTDTLQLMAVTHVLQTLGLLGCLLSRDYGTPKSAALAMGVPNMIGLETIAELLSGLCWGLLCSFGLEFSFCFLTLTAHLINYFDRFVLRLPIDLMRWWDLRLFVPQFDNPLAAQSLASLWSFRWHQLYRRSFIFLGVLPATSLAQKLGLSLKGQRVVGLFGGFFVSAVMHEMLIDFVAPPPYKTAYENTRNFPGSFFYFMMQPIGILLEPYVIHRIPRWLGGGRLWVLLFTLVTVWPFKNQYTVHHHVVGDLYPPLKSWPLFGFFWPPSIMQF